MRSVARGLSRGAVCAVVLMGWMYGPHGAAAEPDAAHALADKFSRAAEDGESARRAKQAKARAQVQAEAKARAEAEAEEQAKAQRARADAKARADARAVAEAQAQAGERARAEAKAQADAQAEEARKQAQRVADEAEMLRAAEEEAEARRREQFAREQQRLIEEKRQAARADAQRMAEDARQQRLELDRQAEERRSAEAERLTREVEEQARAEEQRLAEQRRVAEAKRKAEEARIAEIKRQAEEAAAKQRIEEARVAELKRQAAEAETKRAAEAARVAEQQRIEAAKAAQRTAQEAQREAEAARIAEKFRLARKAREERSRTTSAPDMETRNSLGGPVAEPARPAPLLAAPAATPMSYPQRVTVLIVMQPRRHGFAGKRMTANPVLCVGDSCYVSNGPTSPATVMRRAQALGPGNTLGRNAGVCRNQTTCVFRGVTLSTPQTTMQPVDMGFLRHDRREIRSIEPDRSCDAGADGLSCSTPIISSGYRAWVVPETIAERVGAPALARALDDGLPAARSASAEGWGTLVQTLPTR